MSRQARVDARTKRSQSTKPRPQPARRRGAPRGGRLWSDDGWIVHANQPTDEDRRFCETVFTLSNGYLATRGTCPELGQPELNRPATLLAGVFDKPKTPQKPTRLVIGPDWLPFTFSDGEGELTESEGELLDYRMSLDLAEGTFTRRLRWKGPGGRITQMKITRLVSLAEPHLCCERFTILPENYSGKITFSQTIDGSVRHSDGEQQLAMVGRRVLDDEGIPGGLLTSVKTLQSDVTIATASAVLPLGKAQTRLSLNKCTGKVRCDVSQGRLLCLDRMAAFTSSRDPEAGGPGERAIQLLRDADSWDRLLRRHRQAWTRFWESSDIEIEGDAESQWKTRFVLFHLWQCANENTRNADASIGARGIHGEGYNGHVFWDTETFMLPFFIMTHPAVARALLMYRYRRLPAARRRAGAEDDVAGARFPWESADTGEETTPKECGPDANGKMVKVLTGDQEIHITADVAHAVSTYCEQSGDEDFYLQYGAELILDTARFWFGRLERRINDQGGVRYELSNVIGPDEYHEAVRNNLFTNAMARWNLTRAVAVAQDLQHNHPETWERLSRELALSEEVLEDWLEKALRIVILFDQDRGLYPEFEEFFALEDGRKRCTYRGRWSCAEAESVQIVKQADVLLALHLLPDLADAESFKRHFEYYEPRTTHESSLSPSTHALFAAQAGQPKQALEYLTLAFGLDCENQHGGSDLGVHSANLGGIWKAIVMGMAGYSATAQGLFLEPQLPREWKALAFSVRWRSRLIHFRIDQRTVAATLVEGDEPVTLHLAGQAYQLVGGPVQRFPLVAPRPTVARKPVVA